MDNGVDRLESTRLRAERLSARHETSLALLLGDPRVGQTLGGVRSAEETRVFLTQHIQQWNQNGFGYWAFYDLVSGEFVGRGGLERKSVEGRDEVEVGWAVHPESWNQGIASEIGRLSIDVAFDRLGLTDLVAFTLPDNLPSRRVMEKCGFSYERDIVYKGWQHVLYRIRGGARYRCTSASALHTSTLVRTRRTTSSVNSVVEASPPRSAVRTPSETASSEDS